LRSLELRKGNGRQRRKDTGKGEKDDKADDAKKPNNSKQKTAPAKKAPVKARSKLRHGFFPVVNGAAPSSGKQSDPGTPWFHRLSRPVLFLTISLALVGGYLALTVPISVFPNTDFPRIVVGVDNGVMPIDQMLVTITRPVEEAVNSVRAC